MRRGSELAIADLAWGGGLATLFALVLAFTWGRWTVFAFPLDAGRELLLPRLIQEGHVLYRDIRCFYGPVGYWLNAWLAAWFGGGTGGLWLANVARFTVMIALLWFVARRLLSPSLAFLTLAAGLLPLFLSFMVPYSASVGWGALFIAAALACVARGTVPILPAARYGREKGTVPILPATFRGEGCIATGAGFLSRRNGDSPLRRNGDSPWAAGTGWLIAAAVFLSFAAATKHEHALAAVLVLGLLTLEVVGRARRRDSGRQQGRERPLQGRPSEGHSVPRPSTWADGTSPSGSKPELQEGTKAQRHKGTKKTELPGSKDDGAESSDSGYSQVNEEGLADGYAVHCAGAVAVWPWLPVAGVWLAAVVPLALIGARVLADVPLGVLVYDNLWMSELLDTHQGDRGYGLLANLNVFRTAALVQLTVGCMVAVIVLASVRSFVLAPVRPFVLATVRRQTWLTTVVVAGVLVVLAVEVLTRMNGWADKGLFAFPKPRIRELIEMLPLVALPLALAAWGAFIWRSVRSGVGRAWRETKPRERLGLACVLVYLAFLPREVPAGVDLVRQPLGALVLAWLLIGWLPRAIRLEHGARRVWSAGVACVLLAATACGLDNLAFHQQRPSALIGASAGSLFAYQRRMPFTPRYFEDALRTVERLPGLRAGQSIACVPDGAWVNTLLGLPWPTRDTQWMVFCQDWIVEDLARTPPDYLLVMEPLSAYRLDRVEHVVGQQYEPIEVNASGMTLYQHRRAGAAQASRHGKGS